ncbi:MAG TPA: cyclic nucleotide-binding domain-containing protein [Gaiellaceae bacterium]|nr:cyclic nucleotide-binding domain-containing protein [Gaiellaceae bacterium]
MRLLSQNAKVAALSRVPLLSGLSKRELSELARVAEDLEFPAGRVLAREGTMSREFLAIVEGEVELTKKGRRVKTIGPGDFIGEFSLVVGKPREVTATSKTPLRAFVLTERDFKQLLRSSPGVELKVMRSLVEWIRTLVKDPTLLTG